VVGEALPSSDAVVNPLGTWGRLGGAFLAVLGEDNAISAAAGSAAPGRPGGAFLVGDVTSVVDGCSVAAAAAAAAAEGSSLTPL